MFRGWLWGWLFFFSEEKNTPRSLFLPFFCTVAHRAPVWPCSASAFPRKVLLLLLFGCFSPTLLPGGPKPGHAGLRAIPPAPRGCQRCSWCSFQDEAGTPQTTLPPLLSLLRAAGLEGTAGRGDVGTDAQPLTCRSDLHRARAHLRQPLQADAVLHRPGDRAVPGGGEAAR